MQPLWSTGLWLYFIVRLLLERKLVQISNLDQLPLKLLYAISL